MEPLISVVMPTYNGEAYIAEAVESILKQTFDDFEFLIINESLTNDRTLEIIESFHDARIRIIQKTEPVLSVAESLNIGILQSRGKYIARMDADDIALPERFERQIDFMEQNPEISVLGCRPSVFGDADFEWIIYESHDYIKAAMLFWCAVVHPTVFLRKRDIIEHNLFYDPRYSGEDLELWLRAKEVLRFANLSDSLLKYRVHAASTTSTRSAVMMRDEQALFARSLKKLNIDYPKDYTLCDWGSFIASRTKRKWRERLQTLEALLTQILRQNSTLGVYDQDALNVVVNRYWLDQMETHDEWLGSEAKQPFMYIIDDIFRRADKNAPSGGICLYGLGRIGLAALPSYKEHFKERLICVSDSDPSKWGRVFSGLECVKPDEIPADATIFITTGYYAMVRILPSLKRIGRSRVLPFVEITL